jgi:hypothetical protein
MYPIDYWTKQTCKEKRNLKKKYCMPINAINSTFTGTSKLFEAIKTDKQLDFEEIPINTKPTYAKVSKAKLAPITVYTKQISKRMWNKNNKLSLKDLKI